MFQGIIEGVLSIPPWAALLVVFALPALEASAFVGVLVPGEVAVLLGGVLASQGKVSLVAVLAAAVLGAVIGDQVGYLIGARWGQQLLLRLPDRLVDDAKLAAGQAAIRRLGAKAVIAGRWTASLRALVPGLCGMARMPYRRFAVANVIGGSLWAVAVAVVGYVAGDSWRSVQSALGTASLAAAALVVLALLAVLLLRRQRRARAAAATEREALASADVPLLLAPVPRDRPTGEHLDDVLTADSAT